MATKRKKKVVDEEEILEFVDIMEPGVYRPVDVAEGHYIIALPDSMGSSIPSTYISYTVEPGHPPKVLGCSYNSPWAERGRKYVKCPHLKFSGVFSLV